MSTEKKNILTTVFAAQQEIPYVLGTNPEIKELKKSIKGNTGQSLKIQIERTKLALQDTAALYRNLSDARKRWLTSPSESNFAQVITAKLEIELQEKKAKVTAEEFEELINFLS